MPVKDYSGQAPNNVIDCHTAGMLSRIQVICSDSKISSSSGSDFFFAN